MGGDDKLYGDDGKDTIIGDQLGGDSPDGGDDFLDGGNGKDPLDGDSGFDECVNGEPAINCEA